jgi:hypothetical protein
MGAGQWPGWPGEGGPDEVVLAGFSMGSGEVTRYLGTYGSGRVSGVRG